MAYHDTLFQLGMDLTRSSTAQEEDHGVVARVAQRGTTETGPASGSRIERRMRVREGEGVGFTGQHLLFDLIDARSLDDATHIDKTLRRCVQAVGATLLHVHLHQALPRGGVAGVAVLAEGQISVLSCPESGFAAFDLFMHAMVDAERIGAILGEAFAARDVVVRTQRRGGDRAPISWQAADAQKKAQSRLRKVRAA